MSTPSPQDLLLEARRLRVDEVVARRTRDVVVVLEDLEDPHNIAAVLRSCEALGIQEVHAITRRYAFHPNSKITQGAEKWLDVHLYRETGRCLGLLKERGYLLCATDLGEGAGSLLELPRDRPLALVFGTEKVGVTGEVLARCDLRFKIPMLGFTQSLNISVAAAICLSQLIFARTGTRGLAAGDAEALRQRFYALSVRQRHRLFPGAGRAEPLNPGASMPSNDSKELP